MNRAKNKNWWNICLISLLGSACSSYGISCVFGWAAPSTASPIYQTGKQPKVGIDSRGNVLGIWGLSDGDGFRIQSSRYNAITRIWTTHDQLSFLSLSVDGQGAWEQQLAMDSNGNAIAIWRFDQGNKSSIQASSYHSSTKSWDALTDVQTLSDIAENSYFPHVALAIDNNGDGFAIWQWKDLIQAARYDKTLGWQSAVDVSATNTASTPDLAISSSGNATAVWTIVDNNYFAVQASSYASGSWAPIPSLPILSDTGGNAYWPHVAMDSTDNALAVWYRYDTNDNSIIQSSFKASSSSWTSAQDLSDAGQNALFPRVAMNFDGKAIVVWHRFDGQYWRIQARHRNTAGTWSQIYTLSTSDRDALAPVIVMDNDGNGFAAWKLYDSVGNTRIQVACYDTATQQWTPSSQQPLLSAANSNADCPDIALNENGNGVVGWQQFDGRNWRIQFTLQVKPKSPTNLRASKLCYRYPTSADVVNVLCWDSPDGDIDSYKVYCTSPYTNYNMLLATIPASQGTCFYHHCRKQDHAETYEVSSVDSTGSESETIRIVVG